MDLEEIVKKTKPELEKALNYFQGEILKIRSSKPSASLLENIFIDCFGKNVPLKNLALVSSLGPREFKIQPWDKIYFDSIQKGIIQSGLGINPIAEKDYLRVSFPPLSEDLRKQLVALVGKKTDEIKRTIRHLREEALREIQAKFLAKEVSEDERYRLREKLQELIDEYNEKIEKIRKQKEEEILS